MNLEGTCGESVEPTKKNHTTNWMMFAALGLGIIALIPPVVIFTTRVATSPSLVSPISEASLINSSHSTNATTTPYSPSYYISLSQQYFQDAYMLSQIRQQTEEDKKEIIGKLQQAIDTISEGISLYPKRSELWTQRANIYTAIAGIAPLAGKAATSDLQQVQRLSTHREDQSTSPLQGLELVKDQQANSRDVLVAVPDKATSPYQDTKESPAFSGPPIIPAGQTSITIENTSVTDAAPIYIVPKNQTNATLSVISKQTGKSFTVTLDNAQNTDVPFQYWVTR